MVAQQLRKRLPHAHAGDTRRAGFPRAIHPRFGSIHRAATAEGTIEDAALSRRRALGCKAAKQRSVVRDIPRMDPGMDEGYAGRSGCARALEQRFVHRASPNTKPNVSS